MGISDTNLQKRCCIIETEENILYVKPGANGDCLSWDTSCDLQTALFNAISGDQIWVASGTYKPTTSSNREAKFQLKNGVAIYGGFPATGGDWSQREWETNATTLSGDIGIVGNNDDNSYHVVTGIGVNETAILDGFMIVDATGGGMYIRDSNPKLTNISFSGNSNFFDLSGGGGIHNYNSSPILANITFSNNTAFYGGGMYNDVNSSPVLNKVTFSGNSAVSGGGIYNSYSSPVLTDVTFSNNIATGTGGGIYNIDSNPMLSEVTFTQNKGGGMYNDNSSPTLLNVIFSSNSDDNGGGMHNLNSSPTLSYVSFNNNTAVFGGGIYNSYSSPVLMNVTFSNNIATETGGGIHNIDSNPMLSGVTFTQNKGGGMYNDNSSPTLLNVIFSSNSDDIGGGMHNLNSSPTLTDVTFSGNTAANCSGMLNYNSSPTLSYVTFSDNIADIGGGMCNDYSSPILTNVTFSNNTAFYGGGMYNDVNSSPVLNNVTFSGNSADLGGGLYNNSFLILTNVTFSNNKAVFGGGMYNQKWIPTLMNVTFSNNSAEGLGGGMYNNGNYTTHLTNVTFFGNAANNGGGAIYNSVGNYIMTNSIVWGNSPDQIHNSDSTLMTITYSDIQGYYPGEGNLDADPFLGSLADNGGFSLTHALGAESPAIDAANPEVCPVIDQRSYARPVDGDNDGMAACDMGAYEYDSYPRVFTLTVDVLGNGSVAINPDKSEYQYGEVVSLTATADPGWLFNGWGGDVSGIDNPIILTINDDINITANFIYDDWVIAVSVTPEGSGTVAINPEQPPYPLGSQVTLNAIANPGYSFAGWSGDATGFSNPLILTITGDINITANFTQNEYSLTVAINPIGMGSVAINPLKPNYHYGDIVSLTATAEFDWYFTGWSGSVTGTVNPLTFTITGNTYITANFMQNKYSIAVIINPDSAG